LYGWEGEWGKLGTGWNGASLWFSRSAPVEGQANLRTVSGKSAKVAAMVEGMDARGWDPRYIGWFHCFNRGQFYEAHDVLEDLWLEQGKGGANHRFYKGLIQLAGAFVHLQKGRLGPAVALYRLAEANFAQYPDQHEGIDLRRIRELGSEWSRAVESGGVNPLGQRPMPAVELPVSRMMG
jgi:hypothetical protein